MPSLLRSDLPHFLAGRLVQGDDLGPAGVDQLQVEPVAVEQRRGVHAVLDVELAVAVLHVELPHFLAVEVEAGQVAGADEGVDVLAVRAGRGRGVIPLAVPEGAIARAQLAFPQLLAVGADAHQDEVVLVGAGQEDAIAPDHRRGAALARQRQLPGDVLAVAPFDRQALLAADAVAVGTAPLRPVFGVRGDGAQQQHRPGDQRPADNAARSHGETPCTIRPASTTAARKAPAQLLLDYHRKAARACQPAHCVRGASRLCLSPAD